MFALVIFKYLNRSNDVYDNCNIHNNVHTYTVATIIMFILLIHKYNISRVMFIFSINSLMEIRDRSCYVFVFVLSSFHLPKKYYVEGYYFSIHIIFAHECTKYQKWEEQKILLRFFLSVPCKRKMKLYP